MSDGNKWTVEVDLWRVSLTNTQPHSQASNISVQITKSAPPVGMLPVILHERDDNAQPYKRAWSLRYREALVFDVIGFQTLATNRDGGIPSGFLYLYRSDSGNSVILYQIPTKEVGQGMQGEGWSEPLKLDTMG